MYSHSRSQPVHLPRTLARPKFSEINPDALLHIAPDLHQVPPEYIRRGLRVKANLFTSAISSIPSSVLPSSLPKSHLPPYLNIPLRSSSHLSSFPTHILALSSSKSSSPNDHVPLMPIHSLVLVSHCVNLPRLPPSPPTNPAAPYAALPVVPLTLPNPAAFPLTHAFIYTHAIAPLLSALIPLPPGFISTLASTPHSHAMITEALASGPRLHSLSTFLCAQSGASLSTLYNHASHVTALWRNTVALGIFDPELWDAMDLAWEVVLGALNLASATQ